MLKTVDEYNAEVAARREKASWSGILCPACKERELRWSDQMFASMPPKAAVSCRCGWSGFVNARREGKMGDLIDDTTKAIDIVNRKNLQFAIKHAKEELEHWQRELNRLEALDPDRNRDA